mmetsp:Transcript_55777/g.143726  ORF Transcript_55777/g.143726 Transcript_55777/m.143726 type:complete len:84 (-) Transcript_55777:283-534(-)
MGSDTTESGRLSPPAKRALRALAALRAPGPVSGFDDHARGEPSLTKSEPTEPSDRGRARGGRMNAAATKPSSMQATPSAARPS